MIQNERASRHEHVLDVARQMMTAARTAPKGKGVDIIEIAMVTGDDLKVLSDKMVAMDSSAKSPVHLYNCDKEYPVSQKYISDFSTEWPVAAIR